MMKFIILLAISGLWQPCCGQQVDSASSKKQQPGRWAWVVPSSLVLAGSAIMLDRDADELFLNKYEVREERNEHFPNFSTHVDDYLQNAPTIAAIVLDLCKVPASHRVGSQALLFVKSEFLALGTVYILKYTVGESRPDTGKKNSFPSGHTAQAFTAATFLTMEFGSRSVWIPIGAYTTAATVGAFRLLNNRHWISDVLVGAGIGMLSTDLVYRTHKDKPVRSGRASVTIDPFAAYGSEGLTIRCTW